MIDTLEKVDRACRIVVRCHKAFGDDEQTVRRKLRDALTNVLNGTPGRWRKPIEIEPGRVDTCVNPEGAFMLIVTMDQVDVSDPWIQEQWWKVLSKVLNQEA